MVTIGIIAEGQTPTDNVSGGDASEDDDDCQRMLWMLLDFLFTNSPDHEWTWGAFMDFGHLAY